MDVRRQRIVLAITVIGNFMSAAVYSLQAPFFPAEAEKKGVRPSAYGLVFGIYELVILLLAPFIGSHLAQIGTKFCICTGMFIAATTCTLFGTLTWMYDPAEFLCFAYLIRVLEGIGQCAFSISTLATISVVYPDSSNDKMAMAVSSFTVGMIVSPAMGGILYSVGGFGLPFYTVGAMLYIIAALCYIFMPDIHTVQKHDKSATRVLLKSPGVWLAMFCIFTNATSIGYIEATLEPHLRVFHYPPFYLSLFFIISPATQCVFIRLAGYLVDRGVYPRIIMVFGAAFMIVAFSLVGPLPWTPYETKPYLVVIGLVLCGLGISGELTPGFGEMLRIADILRLPKDENTNGVISGLYQMCMSMGIFLGPVLGGILLEYVGFRQGTLLPLVLNGILLVMVLPAIYSQSKEYIGKISVKSEQMPLKS